MPDARLPDSLSFPLARLGRFLRTLPQPGETDETQPTGTREYAVCTLSGPGAVTGRLRIAREQAATGPVFEILYEKSMIDGGTHRTEARARCRQDTLLTPESWTVSTTVVGRDGNPVDDLSESGSLRIEDDALVADWGYGPVRHELPPGPRTLSWTLFDAVPRLPGDDSVSPRFTLIDHFDRIKGGHSLRFRGTGELVAGGQDRIEFEPTVLEQGRVLRPVKRLVGADRVPCRMYEQTGPGIVPVIYVADTAGRLLIVSSGLEAYVASAPPAKEGAPRP